MIANCYVDRAIYLLDRDALLQKFLDKIGMVNEEINNKRLKDKIQNITNTWKDAGVFTRDATRTRPVFLISPYIVHRAHERQATRQMVTPAINYSERVQSRPTSPPARHP